MGAVSEYPAVPVPSNTNLNFEQLLQLDWEVATSGWPADKCGGHGEVVWYSVVALKPGEGPAVRTASFVVQHIKDRQVADAIAALPRLLRALRSAEHLPPVKVQDWARLILAELANAGVRL